MQEKVKASNSTSFVGIACCEWTWRPGLLSAMMADKGVHLSRAQCFLLADGSWETFHAALCATTEPFLREQKQPLFPCSLYELVLPVSCTRPPRCWASVTLGARLLGLGSEHSWPSALSPRGAATFCS